LAGSFGLIRPSRWSGQEAVLVELAEDAHREVTDLDVNLDEAEEAIADEPVAVPRTRKTPRLWPSLPMSPPTIGP
jgi:hypothetical protein